jgi:hypothetical protein
MRARQLLESQHWAASVRERAAPMEPGRQLVLIGDGVRAFGALRMPLRPSRGMAGHSGWADLSRSGTELSPIGVIQLRCEIGTASIPLSCFPSPRARDAGCPSRAGINKGGDSGRGNSVHAARSHVPASTRLPIPSRRRRSRRPRAPAEPVPVPRTAQPRPEPVRKAPRSQLTQGAPGRGGDRKARPRSEQRVAETRFDMLAMINARLGPERRNAVEEAVRQYGEATQRCADPRGPGRSVAREPAGATCSRFGSQAPG